VTSTGRRFLQLMHGAPISQWCAIASHNSVSTCKFFEYIPNACSIMEPPSSISWIIVWFLVNFSGKFRLCSGRKPPMQWLIKDSLAATNKICWQLSKNEWTPSTVRRRPMPSPMCSSMVGSDCHRWGIRFRRVLLRIAESSAYRSKCGNMFGLVKLASKLIQESEYIYAPLDKEPGFAAIHITSMPSFEQAALPPKFYRPVFLHSINYRTVADEYGRIASDVAKFTGVPNDAYAIRSTLSGAFAVPIGIQVKSH
jgi:hypothetical protein